MSKVVARIETAIANCPDHYRDGTNAPSDLNVDEAIRNLVHAIDYEWDDCLTAWAAGRVKKLLP